MKINWKTKLAYGIGGLGKDMMFAMSTIMLYYFNNLLGISAAFLGLMMMLVRVWDAVNDPIMGGIVDNTKGRWGKFRPWILIGSILNGIVLVFLFFNPEFVTDSVAQYVYITIMYTLWGMTYTLMDIPFWSMIPSLSYDRNERESITVIARLFTSIGYISIAGGYIFFAQTFGGGETVAAETNGMFILAIVVSVIFIVTQIITVTNVKEKITDKHQEKVTLKDMAKGLKDNDQLLVVMVVVLIINFTLYITSGMAIYYFAYNLQDKDLFGLFILVGGVFQVLGSVIYPIFSKRLTRKKIFNFAIIIQFIGFVFLFINAFIISSNVPILFVFAGFIFLGQGIFMVLQTVLLSDTVEYGELKTGRRSEAIVFSVQTFVVKLAMGLSLGVIGVGLTIIKFVSPVESPLGSGEFVEQAQSVFTIEGMSIMMFILPLFGLLYSRYLFNKKHIINEEYYEEMIKELEVVRGSGVNEEN